ncbi:MAG: OmpH family outer membrane protein [Lentimicrobiaceae bacterium]|nr:OmpH family outer membrane protein [Lentimicrobiaceae bacterium]
MRKSFVKILALAGIILLSGSMYAQKAGKIGHVKFNEVLEQMPGQDTVKTVLEKYINDLQNQLTIMQNEYETKAIDYQKNVNTMSSIIKSTKEKELSDLETRIGAFQRSANEELNNKQIELIEPFIEKVKAAINEVAKEGNYAYIFNLVEDLILFSDGGEDVTQQVKAKLNIK